MIFKDRQEAGRKLLVRLFQDKDVKKNKHSLVIVSILRGGAVVGKVLARGLQVKHLPLVVRKISAPNNPELAIGALCFDTVYLEKNIAGSLFLDKLSIAKQIDKAKEKLNSYLKRFNLKKTLYARNLKNKTVILVDDGVATGSTVKAAILYLRSKKPNYIYLAVPVAPTDFEARSIDKEFILHKDPSFGAVSQFYDNFPQIEDEEVKRILS